MSSVIQWRENGPEFDPYRTPWMRGDDAELALTKTTETDLNRLFRPAMASILEDTVYTSDYKTVIIDRKQITE